ncbi:MAG: hypothetical protein FK734_14450 [Asgard group archaeon]|nr:hypothetical protein [Asgard group archaeon]
MSIKEAKDLELLPKLSSNEKRVFSALATYGAGNVNEISQKGGLSRGRVTSSIESLVQRGLIIPLKTEGEEQRYSAIFPIERFIEVIDKLNFYLQSRKEELKATTLIVNDFTENAIKNVRDASVAEREKRNERSEEDIKDLEISMDASFSGILASIEMDMKDLGKIAQTSNEFLTESSIRSTETCANIKRSLVPIAKKFSEITAQTQKHAYDQREVIVDARVSDILDFEDNAIKAFNEVLDAFKDSQDAFENIIFSVLDSGIEDLEKVTRPINDQIEEAIKSLKSAIQEASNNFQTEILRVLVEQKRLMISSVEIIRPKTNNVIEKTFNIQDSTFGELFDSLITIMENNNTLFSQAVEQLANDFNARITNIAEHSYEIVSSTNEELASIEHRFNEKVDSNIEEKTELIHLTSNKTREVLNEMMEQFIMILNRTVAQYQMDLGDLVAKLETDFLNNVERSGSGILNLINYINLSLIDPVRILLKNLEELNKKIEKEESDFLTKFEKLLSDDLMQISKEYESETKKKEENFEKEVSRLTDRFEKEIKSNHDLLRNRLNSSQKNLQALFKNFSDNHEKELRNTSKDISNLTRKLERWRGESVDLLNRKVDTQVNQSISVLSKEIDEIITKIDSSYNLSKSDLIKVVKESFNDISKNFKDFGGSIGNLLNNSLDEISNTLKKDSLTINNRLVEFKKEQDKLLEETKKPSIKLIKDIESDYKELYDKLNNNIDQFFESEVDNFKRNRSDITKSIENILSRRTSRSNKEIENMKEMFERSREGFIRKTRESFEEVEKQIAKDASSLIDQENTMRDTIIDLTEKTITNISNGMNASAEALRTNLWEGSESIFGQASAEINKQEIDLKQLDSNLKDNLLEIYNEINSVVSKELTIISNKTEDFQENQISNVGDFKSKFSSNLMEQLMEKQEELQKYEQYMKNLAASLSTDLKEVIDSSINRMVQELETKTSGIEGAIFTTVGNITSEASRKTEGVVVIGEQAVLGIEDRYTENLERIRQSLTDEVINRIEKEAQRIENYKGKLQQLGRNHLKIYGDAERAFYEGLSKDLQEAEKAALKSINTCESLSCGFLEDLDTEINAIGDRVGISTDKVTLELLDDFDRVLQKVKREVSLFARKQFELSNRSNQEIAEAFLKSVDDLEEVMLKQIDSFTTRTITTIDRTKEMSDVVISHVKDITESFKEVNE